MEPLLHSRAVSPASPASLGLLIWWLFRVARGWFGVSVGLAEVLLRAGLGFVWGSFRPSQGLISRMLLGGFKVNFESAWFGLGLICATCAARFLQ